MKKSGHVATSVVLLLLCLMYGITYIDRVNIATAAIAFRQELGLSNIEYGWIASAFFYSYAMFQIIGGRIGDKYGPRLVLCVCGLIWAASTIGTGLAGGFWSFIFVRFMLGVGEGATFPTATRAMSSWTRPGWRGFGQGITHSFARMGNALTPPLVVVLIAYWGWRGSFVALGLVSLVWTVAWFFYFRNDPREHAGVSQAELAVLPAYGSRKESPKVPWARLVPRMLPTTFVYFCYAWSLWVFLTWLPQFFQQGYGLNLKNSALLTGAIGLGAVLGDTVGGVLSDWIYKKTGNLNAARRNVVILSFLGALLCLIPVFYVHDLVVLGACLCAAFFCLELIIGPIWSVPMDIAPRHSGTASGIMNTGSAVAGIISPVVFGYIVDWSGSWQLPFAVSIGLLLLGAILSFWMRPDIPLDAPSTEARRMAA
ncbi:MAG: MFS transporter [Stellaceae bacterium]